MKIIHCADIHLDSPLGNLSKEDAIKRNQEIFDSFISVVNYAKHNEIENIMISGDLFDNNKIARKSYNNIIKLIEDNATINFYYINGNHDYNTFYPEDVERLNNLYTFVNNKPVVIKELALGNIVIQGLNPKSGGFKEQYKDIEFKDNDYNILMMHGMISEYENNNNDNIAINRLIGKCIDYLALGHIHSYSEGKLDSRGVYAYPGCLEPRGFDEIDEHGFIILDINEKTFESTVTFKDFSKRKCINITMDISKVQSAYELEDEIDKQLSDANASNNDIILITITGNTLFNFEKDKSYIMKQFNDSYYMFRIHDKTRQFIAKSDNVNNSSTLEDEFNILLEKQTGIDVADKDKIYEFFSKALSGEDIYL